MNVIKSVKCGFKKKINDFVAVDVNYSTNSKKPDSIRRKNVQTFINSFSIMWRSFWRKIWKRKLEIIFFSIIKNTLCNSKFCGQSIVNWLRLNKIGLTNKIQLNWIVCMFRWLCGLLCICFAKCIKTMFSHAQSVIHSRRIVKRNAKERFSRLMSNYHAHVGWVNVTFRYWCDVMWCGFDDSNVSCFYTCEYILV